MCIIQNARLQMTFGVRSLDKKMVRCSLANCRLVKMYYIFMPNELIIKLAFGEGFYKDLPLYQIQMAMVGK